MVQEVWDNEDIEAAQKIEEALNDPKSSLSLFLQDLVIVREATWHKLKRTRAENNIHRIVGTIEGLDIALNRAKEIVSLAKAHVQEVAREEVDVA